MALSVIQEIPPAPGDTICLARPEPGKILQKGDDGFEDYLATLYGGHEAYALAQLNQLKSTLRTCPADDYWKIVLQGISDIAQAQMVWVTRRLKVDVDGATELPSIGEPDSAFHCVAWYYKSHDKQGFGRNLRSETYTSPSAYMKYNKVFLLPSGLSSFCPDYTYASRMPIQCESYLGVPLFSDDLCIGHIGLSHDQEGLDRRKLSWPFLEMILRSFEDTIAERVVAEAEQPAESPTLDSASKVATPASVLKPYAQSLSHEIRTPMQGVVGMLDVMQTSLIEAQDSAPAKAENILRRLQEDIEMTQDSCRRAVEAADNVVQAYDLNMGIPLDGPQSIIHPMASAQGRTSVRKKSRDLAYLRSANPPKLRPFESSLSAYDERQRALERAVQESEDLTAAYGTVSSRGREEAVNAWKNQNRSASPSSDSGEHNIHLPDLLEWVINESLKIGGRPKTAEAFEVEYGQVISATFQQHDDSLTTKTIEWRVEPSVPDRLLVHERRLAKIISCVFQNALKFTRQGRIHIHARVLPDTQNLNIVVSDSGSGIAPDFQSHLFEPFSREDFSITRGNDGLGLGLLVAKNLAHKLGGDLQLVRSDRDGPMRGSDFEIDIPFVLDPSRPPSRTSSRSSAAAATATVSSQKRRSSLVSANENLPAPKARKLSDKETPGSSAYAAPAYSSPVQFHRADPFANGHVKPAELSPPISPTIRSTVESQESSTRQSSEEKTASRSKDTLLPSSDVHTLNRFLASKYPLRILVAEDQPINRKLLVKMLTKLGYDPKTQIVEAHDGADALRRVMCARKHKNGSAEQHKGIFGSGDHSAKSHDAASLGPIDVILMDLWMPVMDGYEAAERILGLYRAPLRPSQRRSITEPSSVALAAELSGSAPAKLAAAEVIARDRAAAASSSSSMSLPPPVGSTEALETATLTQSDDMPPVIMAVTADTTQGVEERALRAGMQGCMLKPFKLKELERLVIEGWTRRMQGASMSQLKPQMNDVPGAVYLTQEVEGNNQVEPITGAA